MRTSSLHAAATSEFQSAASLIDSSPLEAHRPAEAAAGWLAVTNSEAIALSAVSWAYALPSLETQLEADQWSALAHRLREIAIEAAAIDLESQPVRWFELRIELPLVLATLFSETSEFRDLAPSCELSLEKFCSEFLHNAGVPSGKHLPELHGILAAWTRCRAIVPEHAGFASPFGKLLKTALHWSGFSIGAPALRNVAWLPAALQIADDSECSRTAQALGLVSLGGKTRATKPKKGTPALSAQHHCEEAGAGILRTDLKPQAARIAVRYDRPEIMLELAQERTFLAGDWTAEIECNGKLLRPTDTWDETCRHDDEEAAYLELETELAAGVRLQRQILLARKEGFIFLADAVVAETEQEWRYRSTLPLTGESTAEPSAETHELRLMDRHRARWILPLALPEWRSEPNRGSLSATEGTLCYRVTGKGTALYAPLWIDCGSQRRPAEATWRRLTVGERLEIVSRDRASAFRVQVEKRQSVFYRALTQRGNRTFLGKNTASEFYAGRFLKTGAIETIMEVE